MEPCLYKSTAPPLTSESGIYVMIIDFENLSPANRYFTMVQTIVPRPIAWILTDNGNHTLNLAPFSFFNGVTSRPPIVSVSIGRKGPDEKKDTWRNIESRKLMVIHIPQVNHADAVSQTAASLPFGESELNETGLECVEVEGWQLPRLKGLPVAFFAECHRIVEVGEGPQGLVLAEIKSVYIDDNCVVPGKDDPESRLELDISKLNPLARLGGNDYAGLGASFTVKRPD